MSKDSFDKKLLEDFKKAQKKYNTAHEYFLLMKDKLAEKTSNIIVKKLNSLINSEEEFLNTFSVELDSVYLNTDEDICIVCDFYQVNEYLGFENLGPLTIDDLLNGNWETRVKEVADKFIEEHKEYFKRIKDSWIRARELYYKYKDTFEN